MTYYIFHVEPEFIHHSAWNLTDSLDEAMKFESASQIEIEEDDPFYIEFLKDSDGVISNMSDDKRSRFHYGQNYADREQVVQGKVDSAFVQEILSLTKSESPDSLVMSDFPETVNGCHLDEVKLIMQPTQGSESYCLNIKPSVISLTNNGRNLLIDSVDSLNGVIDYCKENRLSEITVRFYSYINTQSTSTDLASQFDDENLKILKNNLKNHKGWFVQSKTSGDMTRCRDRWGMSINYHDVPGNMSILKFDEKEYEKNAKRFKSTLARRNKAEVTENLRFPSVYINSESLLESNLEAIKKLKLDKELLCKNATHRYQEDRKLNEGFENLIESTIKLYQTNPGALTKTFIKDFDKVILSFIKDLSNKDIDVHMKQWKKDAISGGYFDQFKPGKKLPTYLGSSGDTHPIINIRDILVDRNISFSYIKSKPTLLNEVKRIYKRVGSFEDGLFDSNCEYQFNIKFGHGTYEE